MNNDNSTSTQHPHRNTQRHAIALAALAATVPAVAADVQLQLDLPTQARAVRPYVAVWLEKAGEQSFAGSLAVWYDMAKRNNAGTKWLKDLRDYWRKSSNGADMAVDGVSGATRAPGTQVMALGSAAALAKLPAGNYEVVVEAAREHGGHDLVRLPLQWPPKAASQASANGTLELGAVRLSVKP